jgi:hypothetical protein
MRKSMAVAVLAGTLAATTISGAYAASSYTVINHTGSTLRVCVGSFTAAKVCSRTATVASNARRAGVRGAYAYSRYALRFNAGGWHYGPQWVGVGYRAGTHTVTRRLSAAQRILGTPRSGLRWHSGAWTGAPHTVAEIENFGAWRGSKPDVVTTYSMNESWQSLATNFWSISVYQGFAGRLNYSLAPIPVSAESPNQIQGRLTAAETEKRRANMREVASGKRDYVYEAQARALLRYGHGDAIVRIAWESAYLGWESSANYSLRNDYKAMWRRVATVMARIAPRLVFEFNVNAGGGLAGSSDRLASLKYLYPGDDLVDLVGMDQYDWYSTQTYGADDSRMLHPSTGPGVLDAIQFARAHRKGFALSEWGLSSNHGSGDNPAYISAMWKVLNANRDVVTAEAYFDDTWHDFRGNGYTKSAAIYRSKW